MPNTTIQIKRSTTTATPPNGSLPIGVPAYSYSSNTLFIGGSDGTGVIPIGGKYYLDTITSAFAQANAAYSTANSGTAAAAAFAVANIAFAQANAAFASGNAGQITANAAFGVANAALPRTGGTITGNLAITGSLTVSGNAYTIDSQTLRVSDPLIYLAGNNYVSDIVDIGFVANYVNATGQNVHTGIFRDATIKEYYVFEGYDKEPEPNHIDTAGNNFTIAVLNATLRTSNIILGGANAIVTIGAAFSKANTANITADLAFTRANVAFAAANAASAQAANADFLTIGNVSSARITGSYANITGVGTLTAGTWNASTIMVAYGGTGQTTLTLNGVLYGNGTGPLSITSAGTEGQVLQASATGVPQFAMLDGGTF